MLLMPVHPNRKMARSRCPWFRAAVTEQQTPVSGGWTPAVGGGLVRRRSGALLGEMTVAESLILTVREGLRSGWPKILRVRRTRSATDARLVDMLEAEIIPRLSLDGSIPATTSAEPLAGPDDTHVAQLTQWLLRQDTQAAWQQLEMLLASGHSLEDLYLDMLAPAARRLGELWDSDSVDFSAVTLGTGYLQELLRSLSLRHEGGLGLTGHHHRILLQPATGEQHGLGISILGELFRRRGWDVCGGPAMGRDQLRLLVAREHFDVVGFSLSAERWVEGLAEDIACVRACSRNADVKVLVGGDLINESPELVAQLGADGTASDGRDAPEAALKLVEAPAANRPAAGSRG